MFWWKKIAIEERLDCYFEECDRCFQMFEKAIATLLEAGNGPAFESAVDRAHESESDADDLRREIELKKLVKQIGRISDLAEHTADLIGIIALKRQI